MSEAPTIESLQEQIRQLTDQLKIMQMQEQQPLTETEEEPPSPMLSLDPKVTDSFGDPIELALKTRIRDYQEALAYARTFAVREYVNMMGMPRYGRHSKLIPVEDVDDAKMDLVWYSGNPIKIVTVGGRKFYKVRLLLSDIIAKKSLLLRIAAGGGQARLDDIHRTGAGRMADGTNWMSLYAPPPPMYKPTVKQPEPIKNNGVGEQLIAGD